MEITITQDSLKKAVRVLCLIVLDILILGLATLLSLFARSDFSRAAVHGEAWYLWFRQYGAVYLLCYCMFAIAIFIPLKLYSSLWEFAGVQELIHIVCAAAILFVVQFILVLCGVVRLPYSYPLLNALFLTALLCASRFGYRLVRIFLRREHTGKQLKRRTLLIGAGSAGMVALREFQTSDRSQNNVVGVVDDDSSKQGLYIRNVRILGNRFDIPRLVEKYRIEEIVLAIPAATVKERRDILEICQKTPCKLKTLPGIFQLANGEVNIQRIRDVDVTDLLGRDSVKTDMSEISGYLRGKTVLVTGGGGSIGSELCRQIAKFSPRCLLIFDIYENNAYDIQQELRRSYPELNLQVRIGSVRDTERVNALFREFRPQIVFHAAAHKHVPLMEDSPNEAIKNNVFGTLHVAKAADRFGAEAFVLISTDKAVNPTNVMGASKRICEMIIQSMANKSKTKFVAVRFGNVLGSNGSVIPLFKRQIAEGGPVTVTHKDIIRYFMTIPEAVQLVLQAGSYAQRGEIFVLDMGEPVRIDDLARNMIRLSGFEPDVDIEVRYTGLRPGEKLYEEMLMKEEGLRSTANELIHIGKPLDIDEEAFAHNLERLHAACERNAADIREIIQEIVPTYHQNCREMAAGYRE